MEGFNLFSDEELILSIRKCKDPGGSRPETLELIERYKGLVRRHARTYFLMGADREDLIQEGMIGLYKAILDYEVEGASGFAHYADLCIYRQMTDAIRRYHRKKHEVLTQAISLDESVRDEEGEEYRLSDTMTDSKLTPEEKTIADFSAREALEAMKKLLSEMEKKVLDLYLEGYDYHEIARDLSITDKASDNAIQRIRRKIRNHFSEGGISS